MFYLLEDSRHYPHRDREMLPVACAQRAPGHGKYGDTLEPDYRLLEALGLSRS